MNSQERVRAVLTGEVPDRVPIGEYAIDFDTVEKLIGHETYYRAKARSKIAFWEGRHDEVADSYLRDAIEFHEKIDLDILVLAADASWQIPARKDDPPPRRIDDTTWEDKYGRVFKYSSVTADIVCVHDPVSDAKIYSVEDFVFETDALIPRDGLWVASSGWCDVCDKQDLVIPLDERSWDVLDRIIQRFKGEKYLVGPSGGEIGIVLLGGLERGFLELLDQPAVVEAATQQLQALQDVADQVMIHPDCDAVLWGLDFGHRTGPFISPSMFRSLFLRANQSRANRIHDLFGKKVIKHCCGNVSTMLDLFVEMGYDCYQSIQASAGMDLCAIKASHGDRVALWGGVPVEHILSGPPDQVRQDVRTVMECAKPGGGFILGSTHSICVGCKYDNFMAMLDEYHNTCDY